MLRHAVGIRVVRRWLQKTFQLFWQQSARVKLSMRDEAPLTGGNLELEAPLKGGEKNTLENQRLEPKNLNQMKGGISSEPNLRCWGTRC